MGVEGVLDVRLADTCRLVSPPNGAVSWNTLLGEKAASWALPPQAPVGAGSAAAAPPGWQQLQQGARGELQGETPAGPSGCWVPGAGSGVAESHFDMTAACSRHGGSACPVSLKLQCISRVTHSTTCSSCSMLPTKTWGSRRCRAAKRGEGAASTNCRKERAGKRGEVGRPGVGHAAQEGRREMHDSGGL